MYSRKRILRALAPYLVIAVIVTVGGGLAYGLGGPAWLVYAALLVGALAVLVGALALLVGALAVLPGYTRWDEKRHPR